MTKAELVEEVARAAELNKRDAEVIVETVFDSIVGSLQNGEKVELRGFGSFRTRERGPRRGRNPKTGEPVDVPAKRVPYFKPGKELKEYFTDEPEAGTPATAGTDQHGASGEAPATQPAPVAQPAPVVQEHSSPQQATAAQQPAPAQQEHSPAEQEQAAAPESTAGPASESSGTAGSGS